MKNIFKRKYKFQTMLLFGLVSFAIGLTCITYATNYNSEEISYDTSTSGAVQANVKDALDFLYNKTKSGALSECPENMSCVEKPGVTLNVTGPGTVNKGTVYVGIGETNIFTVKGGNENEVLYSINCTNDYTVTGFNVMTNIEQEVTITNPNTSNGSTCTITFGAKEISVSSTNLHSTYHSDTCNSNSSGCICYQIAYNVSDFTYEGHTGCNFKSTSCYYMYDRSGTFNCTTLSYLSSHGWYDSNGNISGAMCSGTITCAT